VSSFTSLGDVPPEVSDFYRQYLTVAIFGAVGVGMAAAMLGLGWVLRPKRP
jgi:hypothetical protein